MKIILAIVLCAITTTIGYGLSKQYKKRKRFFEDIIDFSNKLSGEMRFRSSFVKDVCNAECDNYGNELSITIKAFVNSLDKKQALNINSIQELSILTSDDKKSISNFFNSLGKYDLKTQLIEFENHKSNFQVQLQGAVEENKKYSSLFTKLGLIIGLAISIIII